MENSVYYLFVIKLKSAHNDHSLIAGSVAVPMSNRPKIYLGLALSASVCTGIGVFLYYRHRRKIALAKTVRSLSTIPLLPPLTLSRDPQSLERNSSSDNDYDDSESVNFPSEIPIPDGGVPLTPDQAAILTRFLYESEDNEEQLHHVLTNIANASTFRESQINLANADCITRLRELLLTTTNETTKCKLLLALNNLALNEYAITQFSSIVPAVIELCLQNPPKSSLRSYGLTLLINMSVLSCLHEEYMQYIYELSSLIESTWKHEDEALSAGKILINLSKNNANLENLLKLTGIELKAIINCFTSKNDPSSKSDDTLLRYLTFYNNLAAAILAEFQRGGDTNNNTAWFNDPTPQRQGALYFEFFDREKQIVAAALLHPHYTSSAINMQVKRLSQAMEAIRLSQMQSSVQSLQDEFKSD